MKILAIATLLLSVLPARADLYVEPYIGYEQGTITATPKSGTSESGKTSMVDFGGRLGVKSIVGVWAALDLLFGVSGKYDLDDNSTLPDATTVKTEYGLTAGFNAPFGLRAYAGYIAGVTYVPTWTNGPVSVSATYKDATGYKAGLGYKIAGLFAINAEYFTWTPKKADIATVSIDIANGYNEWKETGTRIFVSLPF